MFQWNNIKINEQHRNELIRQAENERLAREAQGKREKSNPVYAPLLAQLGRHLAQFGESLQAEYATHARLEPEL